MVVSTFLTTILLAANVRAEVTRLEIQRREPFAAGHAFGDVGAYETLTGSLYLEVDPSHPANVRIVDLKLAPRNAAGRVEFRTDFFLLKPVDLAKANGCLLYDVNNRGNKLILAAFNEARSNDPSSLADAGNGFLMRRGYAVLWTGWNGDVLPGDHRLTIDLPVAAEGGASITGRIYSEICVSQPCFSAPLCWGNSRVYPSATLDNANARLTMRPRRSLPEVEVPRTRWAFARWDNDKAVPDPANLHIESGFQPGWLYDLVYVAKDPRVSGLGAASVRDAVSFLRHADKDRDGVPNPMAGKINRACAFGISQSARFLNHFIQEDFNGDEAGRTVFDGILAHVGGAGKAIFNARFAQITRHGSQHEEILYPTDVFPFTTVRQRDPVTGQEGEWLERPRRSGHLPRLFITCTSTEYWARGASLLHTDVEGKQDVELDPNVRLYHIAGGHHLFSTPENQGAWRYPVNTLNYRPLLRALLVALDRSVGAGEKPPPSRYPRIADGTLIETQAYFAAFPRIPGVLLPASCYAPLRLDLGPRWLTDGIADQVPPVAGQAYRTLVPAVDADGNEQAGIRLPDLAVPLFTYAGWNLRSPACGADRMLARWEGSQWPFHRTPEERRRTGDPRLSILERHPTRDAYLAAFDGVTRQLRQEGYLLEEDLEKLEAGARNRAFWPAQSQPTDP
ncbi:MAG: hypothetical protein GX616_04255 [Planctomycetes bacterium]|nr:hypothetical protein [Planctomycetota bacterium]